jgi:uncharacterized protein (DUF2235 family)
MPKNIVILCDGTSNQISEQRTNILRLYGCLRRNEKQIVFYDPGVGTFGGENDWLRWTRDAKEIWGLATGWGIDYNVKEIYRFLVENYEPGQKKTKTKPEIAPDQIYIFGFSRGAYTARVLAGFIHAAGIMDKNQLNLLNYAYRTYKAISDREETSRSEDSGENANSAFMSMRLYERTLRTIRPAIKALGLFDTVSSVIEMGRWLPQLKTLPFTKTNKSVEHVRHAVAVDEQRTMFNPLLWPAGDEYWGGPFRPKDPKKIKTQDVKEVWFSGVHGDVGGGYAEKVSAQAKIPLLWMIEETSALGLDYFKPTVDKIVRVTDEEYVKPGVYQKLNNSMTLGWKIVEYLPRRIPPTSFRRGPGAKGWYIPHFDHRLIAEGALVHSSVFERKELDKTYDPPNLPAAYEPVGKTPAG